jgi:hypothetical protein
MEVRPLILFEGKESGDYGIQAECQNIIQVTSSQYVDNRSDSTYSSDTKDLGSRQPTKEVSKSPCSYLLTIDVKKLLKADSWHHIKASEVGQWLNNAGRSVNEQKIDDPILWLRCDPQ